jgi:hypothetical protein
LAKWASLVYALLLFTISSEPKPIQSFHGDLTIRTAIINHNHNHNGGRNWPNCLLVRTETRLPIQSFLRNLTIRTTTTKIIIIIIIIIIMQNIVWQRLRNSVTLPTNLGILPVLPVIFFCEQETNRCPCSYPC